MPPNFLNAFGAAAAVVAIGFVLVSILFIIFFVWIIRLFLRGLAMRDDLRRNGKRIAATVTNIRTTWERQAGKETSDTVYIITASAPDPTTGQPLSFQRKTSILPGYRVGDPVIVLIDPGNPSKYMFDR